MLKSINIKDLKIMRIKPKLFFGTICIHCKEPLIFNDSKNEIIEIVHELVENEDVKFEIDMICPVCETALLCDGHFSLDDVVER